MNSSIDQQFIEYIVKSLVGNPDAVKVERRIDEKGVLLELVVDPDDLGRVIGKRGATAQSLRTLLRALGTKNDARYNLKIIDNGPVTSQGHYSPSNDTSSADDTGSTPVPNNQNDTTVEPTDDNSSVTDSNAQSIDSQVPEREDVVSKTRRELEDLDDLDV